MLFFKRKNSFKQSFKRFFGPIERLENREQPGSLFGVDAMFSPMITSLLDVPVEPISDTTIVDSPVAQPEFLDTSLEAENASLISIPPAEFTIVSDTNLAISDAQVDAGFTSFSADSETSLNLGNDPFAAIFAANAYGSASISSSTSEMNGGNTGNVVTPVSDLSGLNLPSFIPGMVDGGFESSADSLFAALNNLGTDNPTATILDDGSSSGTSEGSGNLASNTTTITLPNPNLNPVIEMNPLMPLPPGAGDLVGVNIVGIGQNPVAPANPVQNNNNPVANNPANPANPDGQLNPATTSGSLSGLGFLGSDTGSGSYPWMNYSNNMGYVGLPNWNNMMGNLAGAGNPVVAGANAGLNVNNFIAQGGGPIGSPLYNPPSNVGVLISSGGYGGSGVATNVPTLLPGQDPPIVVSAPLGPQYELVSYDPDARTFNPALGSTMLQARYAGEIPIAYTYRENQANAVGPLRDGNDSPIYPGPDLPVVYNQMFRLQGRLANTIDRDFIRFTLEQKAGVFLQMNQFYTSFDSQLILYSNENFVVDGRDPLGVEKTVLDTSNDGYVVADMDDFGNLIVDYPIPGNINSGIGVHALDSNTPAQRYLLNAPFGSQFLNPPGNPGGIITEAGDNPVQNQNPMIYRDLNPGTYWIEVRGGRNFLTQENDETGNWQLDFFMDTGYQSTPANYNSQPGASVNLVLDFDGGTAPNPGGGAINTFAPYSIGTDDNPEPRGRYNANDPNRDTPIPNPANKKNEFSPIEQIGINNIFRVVSEDFSPFDINVTTNDSAFRAGSDDFKCIITSTRLGYYDDVTNPSVPTFTSETTSFDGYRSQADDLGYNPSTSFGVVSQAAFYLNFGNDRPGSYNQPQITIVNNGTNPPTSYLYTPTYQDTGYGANYWLDVLPNGQAYLSSGAPRAYDGGLSPDATAFALEIGNSISQVVGFGIGQRPTVPPTAPPIVDPLNVGLRNIGYDWNDNRATPSPGIISDYTLGVYSLVRNQYGGDTNYPPNAASPVSSRPGLPPNNLTYLDQATNTTLIVDNNGYFPGNAEDRIMSNRPQLVAPYQPSYLNPAFPNTIFSFGRYSDAGFSREYWDKTDYNKFIMDGTGIKPRRLDNNDSLITATNLNFSEDRVALFNGVIADNFDVDWYKFSGSGAFRLQADVDDFSGNLMPVFQVFAVDPGFYRPQRIIGYTTFTIQGGTYDVDTILNLPDERDYYIQFGNPFSIGTAAADNALPSGHYRLILTQI